jgi:hypothetical protein
MSRVGVRGNLRPDLTGVRLELTDADTDALRAGETATIRVVGVFDNGDLGGVLVVGDWSGPGGRRLASVAVRTGVLMAHGRGAAAGPPTAPEAAPAAEAPAESG